MNPIRSFLFLLLLLSPLRTLASSQSSKENAEKLVSHPVTPLTCALKDVHRNRFRKTEQFFSLRSKLATHLFLLR